MSELPVQSSADDVHAHARKTGHGRLDLVLALSAIFISAVSLAVAIEHGKTERDLVAANSWPFVQEVLTNQHGPNRDVAFGIQNVGVGPAKIKSVQVFFRGQPVRSGVDLLERCCGLDVSKMNQQLPNNIYTSLADETVLRPGEENVVLAVYRKGSDPRIVQRFTSSLTSLSFKACFCSVLDQCWTADLRTTDAHPVRSCSPPAHPYIPNGS